MAVAGPWSSTCSQCDRIPIAQRKGSATSWCTETEMYSIDMVSQLYCTVGVSRIRQLSKFSLLTSQNPATCKMYQCKRCPRETVQSAAPIPFLGGGASAEWCRSWSTLILMDPAMSAEEDQVLTKCLYGNMLQEFTCTPAWSPKIVLSRGLVQNSACRIVSKVRTILCIRVELLCIRLLICWFFRAWLSVLKGIEVVLCRSGVPGCNRDSMNEESLETRNESTWIRRIYIYENFAPGLCQAVPAECCCHGMVVCLKSSIKDKGRLICWKMLEMQL